MTNDFFNPRLKSLPRSNTLVIASLAVAVLLSGFPHLHESLWLILPAIGCMIGTADTARSLQPRWSMYHAGVILCIYMDLMVITMVLFFLFYPYFLWFTQTR